MASITTILGTDSVSSSRIVLNNNFAALNTELSSIGALFNTSTQTITLTGLITGGTLKVNNATIDTFKVNTATIEVNLPATFSQDLIIGNALIHSVSNTPASPATTLPAANAYIYSTYVLAAASLTGTKTLAAADAGQEITLISIGGSITLSNTNIVGPAQNVVILQNGSITLRYIGGNFYIVSSNRCTITY